MTDINALAALFSDEALRELFPPERADQFFEALFGDAEEGAYDIGLSFQGLDGASHRLVFRLDLRQRTGCCLACNLTYGLPDVFSRHPVIDIRGLVTAIGQRLDGRAMVTGWQLGATVQESRELHVIPLYISLNQS